MLKIITTVHFNIQFHFNWRYSLVWVQIQYVFKSCSKFTGKCLFSQICKCDMPTIWNRHSKKLRVLTSFLTDVLTSTVIDQTFWEKSPLCLLCRPLAAQTPAALLLLSAQLGTDHTLTADYKLAVRGAHTHTHTPARARTHARAQATCKAIFSRTLHKLNFPSLAQAH